MTIAAITEAPRAAKATTFLDQVQVLEATGLCASWHLGNAMTTLLDAGDDHPGYVKECAIAALDDLDRWLDSDYGTSTMAAPPTEADVDDLPSAQCIVEKFGLRGNIAIAVTYLVNGAYACDDPDYDMTDDVEKACAALRAECGS